VPFIRSRTPRRTPQQGNPSPQLVLGPAIGNLFLESLTLLPARTSDVQRRQTLSLRKGVRTEEKQTSLEDGQMHKGRGEGQSKR